MRHPDVRDEDIGTPIIEFGERGAGRSGGTDVSAVRLQQSFDRSDGVGLVVNGQDAKAVEANADVGGMRSSGRMFAQCGGGAIGERDGQDDGESRAETGAAAVRQDTATMHFDDFANDGETKAEAGFGTAGTSFFLPERLEDAW